MSKQSMSASRGGGDAVYGLGIIGAAVYYLQHSHTLLTGLLAILKALVWPTFVVYDLLRLISR